MSTILSKVIITLAVMKYSSMTLPQTLSQKCETSLRWLKRYLRASDHIGMSGSASQITVIQSLFVPDSGRTKPHSFPKAPLCHELSLNATRLSIDLLAMHFLSCFDVIVASVYGRFQIKLWRVLAFKLVISDGGDYLAAVELTFFFIILFFLFLGPQTGLCDSLRHRPYQIKCPSLHTSSMNCPPPATAEEPSADWARGDDCARNTNEIKHIHQLYKGIVMHSGCTRAAIFMLIVGDFLCTNLLVTSLERPVDERG